MECWILFDEDVESHKPGAYEVRRFVEAGRRQDVDVKVFRPAQFDLVVTRDDRESVLIDGNVVGLPDFLIPRTGADTNYFALAVIRQLERLGVQSFNSSTTVESVADKLHSHQILAEHGIPVPNTMLAKFPVDIDLVENTIGFPVVVKTLVGTQGSGVFLCETRENFNDLMELIGETQPNLHLIFQEFIASSHGRDLRVFVVDGKVIAAMERKATDGSFKANFTRGGSVTSYDVQKDIETLALESAKILDLQITGVDILFDEHGYKICEANSAPDFKGLESCCDVSVADEVFAAMRRRMESGKKPLAKFENLRKK